MTETTIEVQDETVEKSGNPLVATARKILLASIGAVVVAQEEIEEFVAHLVERGEVAERDGRRLVNDVVEKRKKQAKQIEDDLEGRVEEILGRLNVPSKADMSGLTRKITALTKKVDALKKELQA